MIKLKIEAKKETEAEFSDFSEVFSHADNLPDEIVTIWMDNVLLVYDRTPKYLEKNTYWDNGNVRTSYEKTSESDGYVCECVREYWENGEIKHEKITEHDEGELFTEEHFYGEDGLEVFKDTTPDD